MADPDTIARVQDAAGCLGDASFHELLRWHRALAGLADLDWSRQGAYRHGVVELADTRARELLHDVRRVSRDPRRHRHGADGKPVFRGGRTLAGRRRQRWRRPPGAAGAGGWTESTITGCRPPVGVAVVVSEPFGGGRGAGLGALGRVLHDRGRHCGISCFVAVQPYRE